MSDQVERKRLQINADDLMTAVQDNSEIIWYLDLETGEVKCLFDGSC